MIAALLLLAAAQAMVAPAPAPAPAPMTAADQAALDVARHRGALLYAYDRAAWLATDDMVATAPELKARAGGWIVDGPADTPELVFFDKDAVDPHILYTARFDHGRLTTHHLVAPGEAVALTPARRALIAARAVGLAALTSDPRVRLCADASPDTVVLPPEHDGDPTLVYLLTPQMKLGSYPVGGHYRVAVSREGKTGAVRRFANSCIDMTPPKDADFFVVTHLLDPVPTELHVFTSLAAHLPLAVVTQGNRFWIVNGDAVILAKTLG